MKEEGQGQQSTPIGGGRRAVGGWTMDTAKSSRNIAREAFTGAAQSAALPGAWCTLGEPGPPFRNQGVVPSSATNASEKS